MPVLPESRSLYINAPLTNISVAYQQGPGARRTIADQVFPVVPVQRQGDLYWKYKKGDWFRSIAGVRAPATESVGGGWEVETDSYFAHVYAVHKDVDEQTRTNAAGGGFDLDRDAALWVTQNLLIKRDRLWVDSFLKTGVWTGGTGIGGGANGADLVGGATAGSNAFVQWDRAGSDPIKDINTQVLGMARSTGFRPNVLVIGPDVWNALTQNTAILDRIRYSERGIITEDLLRAVFNVDRVVVTWAIENTGPTGGTDSFNFMNSKTALLVYAPSNAGLMQPTGGYIFSWSALLGAGAFGTRVSRIPVPLTQSVRVEGEMAFDMKVVSPDVGVLFSGAVQ